MTIPHQQGEYNQLQGARPCVGREPLVIIRNAQSESSCCKAEGGPVVGAKFYCTILGRDINNIGVCWACNRRKES